MWNGAASFAPEDAADQGLFSSYTDCRGPLGPDRMELLAPVHESVKVTEREVS